MKTLNDIFKTAHARAKVSASFDKTAGSYKFHFRRHLRDAWAEARRIQLGLRMIAAAAAREAARDAQNVGLPIRSFRGERSFFRSSRYVAAVGA